MGIFAAFDRLTATMVGTPTAARASDSAQRVATVGLQTGAPRGSLRSGAVGALRRVAGLGGPNLASPALGSRC